MRMLLTAVLLALSPVEGLAAPQGAAELSPRFQKFDRLEVACTVKTEIKASNGRDTKLEAELVVVSEAEKGEGDTATFDVGVSRLRLSGTHEGRKVDAEWSKSGASRGELPRGLAKALEKGWKMTLAGKDGIRIGEGHLEIGDALPVFNPGVLLGLPVPPPFAAVAPGKSWESKTASFPHFGTFGLRATGTFDLLEGDSARLSARLAFMNAASDAPDDFAASVKGDGFASLEYDVKKGRPVKGATAVKLVASQGGLKREVSQVVEFEVRK
jgi:hypothetical protein